MDAARRDAAGRQNEAREIPGCAAITITFNEASFASDAKAVNFLDNCGFHRCLMALRGCTLDATGASVISKGLQQVVVVNTPGSKAVAVAGGVLTVQGDYAAGISGVPSDAEIQTALMEALQIKKARMVHRLTSEQLPERTMEFRDVLASSDLTITWDAPTFTTAEAVEFLDNVGCLRTVMALRTVADHSPEWRAAARAAIARVHYVATPDVATAGATLAGGVLTVTAFFDRPRLPSGMDTGLVSHDTIAQLIINSLGLRASAKVQEIRDKAAPERAKEYTDELGAPVAVSVDFGSFNGDDSALNFVDNVALFRIAMALRCADGATKAKLKSGGLKAVAIVNVASPDAKALTLSPEGVLTLAASFKDGLSGAFSDNEVLAKLRA